ncbi:MAG: methyltransferase domain-containing protein [Chitinophagaceae bacterium]
MNTIENISVKWDSKLYDDKHDFVFKYGEDLINVLQPQQDEYILDLGCGTGHLTKMIADAGAKVMGIDSSVDMIQKAKKNFPAIDFRVQSATEFVSDISFDAVFSNAVLHWVLDKEAAIDCIYRNLKKNGRFVMEMGGKRNVENILFAFRKVLSQHGYIKQAEKELWYFPSLSEYTGLLEKRGFRVTYASHFNRDTVLKHTENGLKDWLRMFAASFLEGIDKDEVENILTEVEDILRPTHFRNEKWFADYKRLRVVAVKAKEY